MAAQYNELAAKAKEIRETMRAQLAMTAKFRQKTEKLNAGILPAVEAKLNDSSAKTDEIAKTAVSIASQIPLTDGENQAPPYDAKPASFHLLRRKSRLF